MNASSDANQDLYFLVRTIPLAGTPFMRFCLALFLTIINCQEGVHPRFPALH
jgi:hypothetical protein